MCNDSAAVNNNNNSNRRVWDHFGDVAVGHAMYYWKSIRPKTEYGYPRA